MPDESFGSPVIRHRLFTKLLCMTEIIEYMTYRPSSFIYSMAELAETRGRLAQLRNAVGQQ